MNLLPCHHPLHPLRTATSRARLPTHKNSSFSKGRPEHNPQQPKHLPLSTHVARLDRGLDPAQRARDRAAARVDADGAGRAAGRAAPAARVLAPLHGAGALGRARVRGARGALGQGRDGGRRARRAGPRRLGVWRARPEGGECLAYGRGMLVWMLGSFGWCGGGSSAGFGGVDARRALSTSPAMLSPPIHPAPRAVCLLTSPQ